jgi:ABC-type uncharacterized transport system permease subunit
MWSRPAAIEEHERVTIVADTGLNGIVVSFLAQNSILKSGISGASWDGGCERAVTT